MGQSARLSENYSVFREVLGMGLFDFLKKKSPAVNEKPKKSSMFSGYRLISTLDTHTCLVCGSLDGKIFETEEMSHRCLNENCRCVVLPVIKGMDDFDEDDERASMDGPVPASRTYAKWLKKQPATRKKEILGKYYDQYKNGVSLEELAKLMGNEAQNAKKGGILSASENA